MPNHPDRMKLLLHPRNDFKPFFSSAITPRQPSHQALRQLGKHGPVRVEGNVMRIINHASEAAAAALSPAALSAAAQSAAALSAAAGQRMQAAARQKDDAVQHSRRRSL